VLNACFSFACRAWKRFVVGRLPAQPARSAEVDARSPHSAIHARFKACRDGPAIVGSKRERLSCRDLSFVRRMKYGIVGTPHRRPLGRGIFLPSGLLLGKFPEFPPSKPCDANRNANESTSFEPGMASNHQSSSEHSNLSGAGPGG
jgi:hypothetical protein